MASSPSTIREFLVALGFKVDEASFSKFDTGIGRATKISVGLGEAVIATATAVEVAVVRIARQFETLYYASARTGASVASLQAFTFGARQIGVAADASRSAVEGLARAMRTSPGVAALLNQLGIRTQGRDTTQILNDFVGQMRKLPFYLAAQYGASVGIDPDTLLMLEQGYGKLAAAQEDYGKRQKAAGIDADDLAANLTKTTRALDKLLSDLDILGQRIAKDFVGPVTTSIEVVDELVQKFNEFDAATDGIAGKGVTGIIAFLALLAARAVLLRTALLALGPTAEGVLGFLTGRGLGAGLLRRLSAGAGAVAAGGVASVGAIAGAALLASTRPAGAGEDEITARRHMGGGAAGSQPIGIRNNNPGNLRPPGASSGFQKFPTAVAGLSALAGQLLRYGDRGLDTLNSIINRYAPASENDTAAYIRAASQQTGFDPDQQLNLRDPAVLQKVMDAIIKHENGFNPYGADLERAAVNARLGLPNIALTPAGGGARPVTVSQKTEISVNGAGDPRAVAATVVGQQNRVNADIVRNMSGVVR